MDNEEKKNFVFVYLSVRGSYYGVNHGIANLTPILKKHGYKVSVIYLPHEISDKEFRKRILRQNPSIVGFSCVSTQLKYLIKYSNAIADIPDILQIAGGVGPTLSPELVLNQSNVKGVVISEGEIPLTQFLDKLEAKEDIFDAEGFYWNINGQIKKNSIPHLVADLSTLDFPDYSIFDQYLKFFLPYTISVQLSRGCPFNCSYCCNSSLRSFRSSSKEWFRVPSVEYSIQLLESLIKHCPETKIISFSDELLTSNREWFLNFAREYEKRINLPYGLCIRGETINTEILEALKRSQCNMLYVGLESGDEQVRKSILNRHYSNEMFIERCKMITDAGIRLFTFNIVGFPHETTAQMEKTLKLNQIVKANGGTCSFFYPFPKTKLYEVCKKEDLLPSQKEMLGITSYHQEPTIKMTSKQRRECIKIRKKIIKYLATPSADSQGIISSLKVAFFVLSQSRKNGRFFYRTDRFIGQVGIFLKNNFSGLYQVLKKIAK